MYESKIQELCHKQSWSLPDYKTARDGPLHNPRFTSTVIINGLQFHSPEPARTAKEAQNNAAKIAFDHFSLPINPNPNPSSSPSPNPSPSPSPSPSRPQLPSIPGCSIPQPSVSVPSATSTASLVLADSPGPTDVGFDSSVLQQSFKEGCQTFQISGTVTDTVTAGPKKDTLHLYKNQLQNYAQKRNVNLPVYSPEWEGPPHALRFKCKVTVDGQTFESPKFFSTLKEAESAAAEVALMSLSPGGVQEDQTGFYKNLLQELVHKEGFRLPSYNTNRYGESHMPMFVSQAVIEGESFTGQEAKSKKQAEMNAAKVAYMTLKERKGMSDQSSLFPLSAHQGQAPELSSDFSEANVITDLQHHANLKSPVSLGLVTQKLPGKDKEPVVTEKKRSSSARNTNGSTENSSLSNVKFAPSLSDNTNVVSDNSNMPSAQVSTPPPRKKVVVYSRGTNVQIEAGGTLMPISDDKWVAYSYSH